MAVTDCKSPWEDSECILEECQHLVQIMQINFSAHLNLGQSLSDPF